MFFISMLKPFLDKVNAILPLVLGILAAAAINRAFISFLDDILKPFIAHVMGLQDWGSSQLVLSQSVVAGKTITNAINFGHFGEILFDLLITGIVVLMVARLFLKSQPRAGAPGSTACPNCKAPESDIVFLEGSPWAQIDFSPELQESNSGPATSPQTSERVTSSR